jgi:hypothetical protein
MPPFRYIRDGCHPLREALIALDPNPLPSDLGTLVQVRVLIAGHLAPAKRSIPYSS